MKYLEDHMQSILSVEKQIGLRLAAARKAAGYKSIREFILAHKLKYTPYRHHELGSRPLTVQLIFHYSNLLGIDPGWLLTGKGYPCQNIKDNAKKNHIMETLVKISQTTNLSINQYSLIAKSDTFVNVDLSLLMLIFEKVLSVSVKNSSILSYQEIINFCIDTYNSVIKINSDEDTKHAMIDLSVKSLFKGMKEQAKQESALV